MISKIYPKNNNPDELRVVEIVKNICDKYVVPTFTHEVVVKKGAIPHSHPVLTLNTRTDDERIILKTLVHEQFHWYAQDHENHNECIVYLKTKYEDDGEHNKSGTYPDSYWEHIIVCFNTRNHLKSLLSDRDIEWIYEQWQAYPTLEQLTRDKFEEIESDLQKFDIVYFHEKDNVLLKP